MGLDALARVLRYWARPAARAVGREVIVTGERRPLDDEVRALSQAVRDLEARVAALEGSPIEAPAPTPSMTATSADEAAQPEREVEALTWFTRSVPFVGRLLLILGGAYLLRALTDRDVLPAEAGVAAGLLYAGFWLVPTWRAAARRDSVAAGWYAMAAAMVAFPLIGETSVRLNVMGPLAATSALAVLVACALGLWYRFRAHGVAWIFILGACACAHALLLFRADMRVPISALLVVIGGGALWIGIVRDGAGPAWVAALAADLAMVFSITLAPGVSAEFALAILLALPAVYVGSIATYSLARVRRVSGSEVVQSALALALGFGGALSVATSTGTAETPLGITSVAIGAALYLLAFRVVDRERRRSYIYLTTVALVLVVAGSGALLPRPALPWAALAVVTAVLGWRFKRLMLSIHAMLYVVFAASASGLFAHARAGWLSSADDTWEAVPGAAWLALVGAVVCATLPTRAREGGWKHGGDVTHVILLAIVLFSGGGVLMAWAAGPAWGHDVFSDVWLGVLRTALLVTFTLLSAVMANVERYGVLRWVVWPLLGITGFKLLFDDLPNGRPLSLSVSFLLYGTALIVGPRLLRRARLDTVAATAPEPEPAEPDAP